MKRNEKIKNMNEYRLNKKNKYRRKPLKKIMKISIKFGSIVFIFIFISTCMYGYSELSKLKYEIGKLEEKLHKKNIEKDNIKVEIDLLTTSRDIEKKATEELEMNYPKESQIRYIEVNK